MQRIGYIKVEVIIRLDIVARIKICRCIGAERSINGVEDKEIGMVPSKGAAQIPVLRACLRIRLPGAVPLTTNDDGSIPQ